MNITIPRTLLLLTLKNLVRVTKNFAGNFKWEKYDHFNLMTVIICLGFLCWFVFIVKWGIIYGIIPSG